MGQLDISVSNLPSRNDQVSNRDLEIQLPSQQGLSNIQQLARANGLLSAVVAHQNNDNDQLFLQLFAIPPEGNPVRLSEIDITGQAVHQISLSEHYLVVESGARHELHVYDISNVYAPQQVNHILNATAVAHQPQAAYHGSNCIPWYSCVCLAVVNSVPWCF